LLLVEVVVFVQFVVQFVELVAQFVLVVVVLQLKR